MGSNKIKLDKNERSILAFFPADTMAFSAVQALKDANLVPTNESIQLEQVSQFGVMHDTDHDNPINNALTQHGPTIYSSSVGISGGLNPLLAAYDSESGPGINTHDPGKDHAFMVTLVTTEENVQTAVAIMKANGGRV